jgi:hypothetical protein
MRDDPSPVRAERGLRLLQRTLGARTDCHVTSLRGKTERYGAPDAAAPANDDTPLVNKFQIHSILLTRGHE